MPSEPVVFIHGLFQMLAELDAGPHFSPRRVLIPDLPGYGGKRSAALHRISIDGAADSVRELIGNERAHVVGHSIGGAVAISLASRYPEAVASVINIEGNFTLKDAFWSGKLAAMSEADAVALLDGYRSGTAGWLARQGIEPTAERVAVARRGLDAQAAQVLQAMARSVIEVTGRAQYLDDVRAILDRGTPMHLVAGERSRAGWDVPAFVLERAASFQIQPGVGHMMMLEAPDAFLRIVAGMIA